MFPNITISEQSSIMRKITVGAKKVPVLFEYNKLYRVKTSVHGTLSFYSLQPYRADWVLEPPHKLLTEQLQLLSGWRLVQLHLLITS